MTKSISNIVQISSLEKSTTSIDDYFKVIMLVDDFQDSDLITGQTFASAGYEEYTALADIALKFPASSNIYKWAADAFAQKANSGVNGSVFETLTVVQALITETTDATYLAALNRVDYRDAYWVTVITDVVAEIQSVYTWVSTRYKLLLTQDDSANLLDSGDATDIASVSKAASSTRIATFYHSDQTAGLAISLAAIMSTANPGDKAAFFKTPSGITVDTLTSVQSSTLDGKNANYFDILLGNAGTISDNNLTFNGLLANGDQLQKTYQNDRILLQLQARGVDVLNRDIPYDERGAAQLEGEFTNVLRSLRTQEIIKEQVFTDRNGNDANGFNVKVYSTAVTAVDYPDNYAAQQFVVEVDYLLALTAAGIVVSIEFSV